MPATNTEEVVTTLLERYRGGIDIFPQGRVEFICCVAGQIEHIINRREHIERRTYPLAGPGPAIGDLYDENCDSVKTRACPKLS